MRTYAHIRLTQMRTGLRELSIVRIARIAPLSCSPTPLLPHSVHSRPATLPGKHLPGIYWPKPEGLRAGDILPFAVSGSSSS